MGVPSERVTSVIANFVIAEEPAPAPAAAPMQVAEATPATAPAAPNAAPTRVPQATTPAAQSGSAPNAAAQPKPALSIPPCDKPGSMGLARIVEIDTTGGPGFGFEHFKQYDFLRDKEVVLTFDDGPGPATPPP